ncbi:MAG: hypothetical protein U0236_03500 [Nitrospira sp.]
MIVIPDTTRITQGISEKRPLPDPTQVFGGTAQKEVTNGEGIIDQGLCDEKLRFKPCPNSTDSLRHVHETPTDSPMKHWGRIMVEDLFLRENS